MRHNRDNYKILLNNKYQCVDADTDVYEFYRIDTGSSEFEDVRSEISDIYNGYKKFSPKPISLPLEDPRKKDDESMAPDIMIRNGVIIVSDRLLKVLLKERVQLMGKRPCLLTCKPRKLSVPYWNIIPFAIDCLNHEALIKKNALEISDDRLPSKLGLFCIDTLWTLDELDDDDVFNEMPINSFDLTCTKKLGEKLLQTQPDFLGLHVFPFDKYGH